MPDPKLAAALLDRLSADDGDQYEAMYLVALDETGDPAEALKMADEAIAAGDGTAVHEAKDESGHEHKGKGEGGGQFTGSGGGGGGDDSDAGRTHDLIAKHVAGPTVMTAGERSALAAAAVAGRTSAKALHRVASTDPKWKAGSEVGFDAATSFSRADLTTGKSAGAIGWKSSDKAMIVIDSPRRGLDVDYKAAGGSFDTAAEQETIVGGRYRVKAVRLIPEPGTNPNDGYTVPQYVLEEIDTADRRKDATHA